MTTSNTSKVSCYIHGAAPEEQQRLSMLNNLLNERCLRELNLKGGERILDVGSGLGQLSRAMARASGVKVTCIERDQAQLASAQRLAAEAGESALVEFRQGDATDLPLTPKERGSFDVVFTRFLLEHVPHPQLVVEEMLKAARAGGRVVLADDDHITYRCIPEPPGFAALWQAYIRSYDRLGNDPYVGMHLVSLLYEAGARQIRNSAVFFGDCAGNPTFQAYSDNVVGILLGAKKLIIREKLLDEQSFDLGIEGFRAWSQRPDAAMWYTICWAEGVKVL
jgi:SAM-dependent methyltransferase